MAQLFEDEKKYPDNRARENFVFLGYPFKPPLPLDDYRQVTKELEQEYPVRLWYFLDEITTAEMMRKIWRAVLRADFAIFDVSGGNSNVAFELGLAVAMNKPCMTLLKSGEPNPLGAADLGYAERTEYSSAATLKEALRKLLEAKSTALRRIKEISYHIFDSNLPTTQADLQARTRRLLSVVYSQRRIAKGSAEKVFADRKLADAALNKLREMGVLQIEGQRGGARWIFSDNWVYHDHEVAGV
jgi:hypothetical protein